MKKYLAITLLVVCFAMIISSCRSKHGTCAAYTQAPVKQDAKPI
ncbi:MAG TPA: hypothetical protein VF411_12145 [Bacteroidia bacterium]